MEYTQLNSLVPAGEHFDSSAINEGIYLTSGHVEAIENALASNSTTVSDLNTQITNITSERDTAQSALATANQTIADRDATIEQQAQEIATLKAGAAGSMKSTEKTEDNLHDSGAVVESAITKEAKRLRELRDKK